MKSAAIVFQSPCQLSVQPLPLRAMVPGDIEVQVEYSGISTGTERLLWDGSMPPFPGMGYPLVPGYETVGRVVRVHGDLTGRQAPALGDRVFVPGSYSFEGVHNLFGGAGSRLVVPADRVVRLAPDGNAQGASAVLLALAATAYHSVTFGGSRAPATPPELIIGHGVMGRLLARLNVEPSSRMRWARKLLHFLAAFTSSRYYVYSHLVHRLTSQNGQSLATTSLDMPITGFREIAPQI